MSIVHCYSGCFVEKKSGWYKVYTRYRRFKPTARKNLIPNFI